MFDSSLADEKSPRMSNEKKPQSDKQDVESGDASLDRTMSSRHLQFIAIGGTIGTGLFLGVGPALVKAGPVSLLVAFAFIGSVVYSVMVSLGEMAAYIPITGSFTSYAARFVDPTLGFAMGWLYWFNWSITFALELVAAGIIMQYWDSNQAGGPFHFHPRSLL
jgi:amino acid transporter